MSVELNTSPIQNVGDLAARIANPFQVKINPLGDKGRDFPKGFEITEYVQGVASPTIYLSGNMMPMIPFEWGVEQRLVKEYYPGNPEAAVQVLGPKLGSYPIKGRFKDKRYRDPTWYGVAYQMTKELDEVAKRGNVCKFALNGLSGSWIRYGFLERNHWKMEKLGWIDYDIELFLVSETQPRNNYFASDSKDSPSTVNAQLLAQVAAFQQLNPVITLPRSLADLMNGLISDVATQVNKVTGFVGTVIGTVEGIEGAAVRAVGLVMNAQTTLASFQRRIGAIGTGFSKLSSQAPGTAAQAVETYKNLSYINEVATAAIALAKILLQLKAQINAIVQTLPMARYKVTANDTLQTIAVKFYGTMDNWDKILAHNKLKSTSLIVGSVLEIPHL